MATETEIQNVAENAGEHFALAAEMAVENAVSDIAQELEVAQERLDHAQEVAEDIARAAMETELGRQISALNEQVAICQIRAAEAVQENQTLRSELATMQTQLQELATPSPLLIQPQTAPEPSTLSEQVAEAVEEVTDPATAEIVVDAQPEAEKPVEIRAKKRFLR